MSLIWVFLLFQNLKLSNSKVRDLYIFLRSMIMDPILTLLVHHNDVFEHCNMITY
jgi:hypothetical protein